MKSDFGRSFGDFLKGWSCKCSVSKNAESKNDTLVTRHLSLVTRHLSLVTRHSSLVTRHLSLVTCHLSLVTCHLSLVTRHLLNIQTMTKQEVLAALEEMGTEQTKKTYTKHGATGDFFGVKVGDLKKIQKKVKKNHPLALELFKTDNVDAMYLAGLIADEKVVTKKELDTWAKQSNWYMISEFTIAWIAADSPHGWDMGLKWIKSKKENIASSGWATLASWISIKADDELELKEIEALLGKIEKEIHTAPNRVRYAMNGFVISVGSYIESLTEKAQATAKTIGKVEVFMGETSCKVPTAWDYIKKIKDEGRISKKRKMARC